MVDLISILVTKMNGDEFFPKGVHLAGVILYILLLILYVYFLIKIRTKFLEAGQWNNGWFAKTFFLSIVGIFLLILNFFITKLFLFLSDGSYTILYQEKGILAQLGLTLFFISFPFCGLVIINVSEKIKRLARISLLFISSIVIISIGLTIFSIIGIFEFPIKVTMSILSIFLCTILSISMIILFKERNNSFSRINKVRIEILIIGLFFILFDIIFIMIGFLIQVFFFEFFGFWNNVIQPIQRFIFYSISISCLYWSFFFPLWLQIRTGVLPPSFKKLIKKRQIMTFAESKSAKSYS